MKVLYGVVILLVLFGVGIKYFKWYFLISGYNLMSKKQKENVDIEKLGKLMGNFMFLLAFIISISVFFQSLGYKNLTLMLLLLILPCTIILIIMAQKYDHNKTRNKNRKNEFIVAMAVLLTSLVLISGVLIVGIIEPKVEVNSENIIISGLYKRTIKTTEIEGISLEENIPKVLNKVNGFDWGYTLRGSFNLEGIGQANIYIQENQSPYIVINTENRLYIINYKDPEKTINLYNKLIVK